MSDEIRGQLGLFLTGFLQVSLVCLNTYQIAHEKWVGVFLVGVGISLLWTINVKRIAFGGWLDRFIYAFGAGVGSVAGLLIGKIIY